MKGDRLYDVIEFILNEATEQELEVVRSALKRRIEGNRMGGAMGIDPGRIAQRTASSIREQMGLSVDQIRSMVSNFAVEIIRKNAPELSEAQIQELLETWIPEPGKGRARSSRTVATEQTTGGGDAPVTGGESPSGGSPRGERKERKPGSRRQRGLSPEVILTMVTQFLSYGDESMSISEQVKLNQEIPDWQRRYWEQFSPRIRELLSLHLKGQIDRATCLGRVCADLGIDVDFSS